MKNYYFLISMLVSFALLLSACGGGGGGAPSTNLTVSMTDFSFTPGTFTVPAGQEITIALSNEGAVEHELVIMKFGAEVSAPFDQNDQENVYWHAKLLHGGSETLTFTAPTEPGEYLVSCSTSGHHEAGMQGKMIVVE